MRGRRKLAGLLLEAVASPTPHVAIGCGINCAHSPDATPYPVTSLSELGYPIHPDALFEQLRGTMYDAVGEWGRGASFEALRLEWLRHSVGMNEVVTVNTPAGPVRGVAQAVSATGAIVLRTPEGVQEITAGDFRFANELEPNGRK